MKKQIFIIVLFLVTLFYGFTAVAQTSYHLVATTKVSETDSTITLKNIYQREVQPLVNVSGKLVPTGCSNIVLTVMFKVRKDAALYDGLPLYGAVVYTIENNGVAYVKNGKYIHSANVEFIRQLIEAAKSFSLNR